MDDDYPPVLIGVGELVQQDADLEEALDFWPCWSG